MSEGFDGGAESAGSGAFAEVGEEWVDGVGGDCWGECQAFEGVRGWFLGTRIEGLLLVLSKATFPYRQMTYTHNEISCFFFFLKNPPFRPSFRSKPAPN